MKTQFLERFGSISLLAGFLCYLSAFSIIILAPIVLTTADQPTVIDVDGNSVEVPAYTEQEARGRAVYIDQMCWHCHSQFVRPVNEEWRRWGPVSQAGESAIDKPHLYGTRRIGPDLAREGGRRIDDWQYAHLFDPRSTVAGSVMPSFTWFFGEYASAAEIRELLAVLDSDGDGLVSPVPDIDSQTHWPDWAKEKLKSPLLDVGGVLAPTRPQTDESVLGGTYEDVFTGRDDGDGILSDYDARPRPNERAEDVVVYLQRLGTAIGMWREPLDAPTPIRTTRPRMKGVQVEWQNEAGETRTLAVEDGEMPLRAREARRYGAHLEFATPAELVEMREAQSSYDALITAWRKANPEWHRRLDKGKDLFDRHCASCHGDTGRGNGAAAQHLLVRPRDFTQGKYRYRSTQVGTKPLDGDLYRSIYRGLPGSSMPPWKEIPPDEIWLLVDYVKSFQESVGGYAKAYDEQDKALAIPTEPRVRPRSLEKHLARGRAVYMAMKCYDCHGSEGRGDGPGWNKEKDNGGRIRPRDFKARDEKDQPDLRLRGGATARDLYRTVFTGLEGAAMPSSLPDFENAWKQAAKVAELERSGASADEIAAAKKSARRKLAVAVEGEFPGVVRETDANGNPVLYLEQVEEGDDWALIHYVMSLAEIPIQTVK